MRIGLVELLLILLIATLSIGPSAALWVERWMRRAQRSTAAAARRRAAQEAQRAAEREEVLQRFQKLSIVFVFCAAAALIWGLVLRPIDVTVTPYTAPEVQPMPDAGPTAESGNVLSVTDWRDISCIRERDGWLYFAAQADTRAGGAALLRMREDGSGLSSILTADGEITGFDFDPDGDIWYTVVTASGGALCRAGYDGWGAASEQIVTQIDGTALSCPTAVAVGADGSVYFTDAAAVSPKHGVESALRTELVAHTGTGSVYVYDPAARTVQTVLTGAAGASGLALDKNGTRFRPRHPLRLERGGLGPRPDRRRQELRDSPDRSARIPRCTGAGRGRHPVYQLSLGPCRLAGKPRGQYPAAGSCPPAEPDDAAEFVLPARREHPGRSCRPRRRAADHFRQKSGQHHRALPRGQPGVSGYFRGNRIELGKDMR